MLGTYIVSCARLSTVMSFLWNLHYFEIYSGPNVQVSFVSDTIGLSQVASRVSGKAVQAGSACLAPLLTQQWRSQWRSPPCGGDTMVDLKFSCPWLP